MRSRYGAFVDLRNDAVNKACACAAHLQDRRHSVCKIDSQVVAGLGMSVHVGQPGRQIGSTMAVNCADSRRHREVGSNRLYFSVLDEHGLVPQDPLAIHGDHIDVDENENGIRLGLRECESRQADGKNPGTNLE